MLAGFPEEEVLQEKVLQAGFPRPLKLHSHDYVGQLFYLPLLAHFPGTRGAFCLPACTNQAVRLKRHTQRKCLSSGLLSKRT